MDLLECLVVVLETHAYEDPRDVEAVCEERGVDPEVVLMLLGFVPGRSSRPWVRIHDPAARRTDPRARLVERYLEAVGG